MAPDIEEEQRDQDEIEAEVEGSGVNGWNINTTPIRMAAMTAGRPP